MFQIVASLYHTRYPADSSLCPHIPPQSIYGHPCSTAHCPRRTCSPSKFNYSGSRHGNAVQIRQMRFIAGGRALHMGDSGLLANHAIQLAFPVSSLVSALEQWYASRPSLRVYRLQRYARRRSQLSGGGQNLYSS